MSNIKIIDNFLLDLEYNRLCNEVFKNQYFPWWYSPTNCGDEVLCQEKYNYQFVHLIYYDNQPKSEYYFLIAPFLHHLKIKSLIKAKFNCNPFGDKIVEHGYHIDTIDDSYNSTTGVYYLNDSDGYTKFETGEKVNSVANRLVLFPSNLRHTGTNCTDVQARYVLNINYF
jgi:hypothetical protein